MVRLPRKRITIAVLATALLAGPLVTAVTGQELVVVVRHAERLNDSPDSPLSPEGRARAERLAQLLRDAGITAIFVSEYQRAADTARPLADLLGLPLVPVPSTDLEALLARIRKSGPKARVLVAGHSDTVPKILAALGYRTPVLIGRMEYDNLFVVMPGGPHAPVVVRLRY